MHLNTKVRVFYLMGPDNGYGRVWLKHILNWLYIDEAHWLALALFCFSPISQICDCQFGKCVNSIDLLQVKVLVLILLSNVMRKPGFVICKLQRHRSAFTSMWSDPSLWCLQCKMYNYTFTQAMDIWDFPWDKKILLLPMLSYTGCHIKVTSSC